MPLTGCLELVFKVRSGLLTPPVPWLAKSSSVQVGRQELRLGQVPAGTGSAAASALGPGGTSPSPGLGAAPPWRLPLPVFYDGGGWGKFEGVSAALLFCCRDPCKLFSRQSFPSTIRSGAP